jgi:SAM-dependent methyltransferase
MDVVGEQARYYRERAPEYDDWWFRRGSYDRGPHENARWFTDRDELVRVLERFDARGDVLELAGGTGLWTERLVRTASWLTVVDASREMIALNRARVRDESVAYVEADVFSWTPPRRFDACFFSFWLSHVPEERFDAFWETVARALRPDGRVFVVDSAVRNPLNRRIDDEREVRRLSDGREFEIVKRYWEPGELEARLAAIGWSFTAAKTANGYFIHGSGACRPGPRPRV